jgi:hypothetical protein
MEVEMGNLEPGDHEPDAGRVEGTLQGGPDLTRDGEQVVGQLRGAIDPMIDLLLWHDQSMTRAERVDGEKGNT